MAFMCFFFPFRSLEHIRAVIVRLIDVLQEENACVRLVSTYTTWTRVQSVCMWCVCDIYMHVCRLLQDIRYKSIYLDHLVTIWLWKHDHEICLVVSLYAQICVCLCDWLASKQQSDLRPLWHIHGLWCVSTTYRMTADPEMSSEVLKVCPWSSPARLWKLPGQDL